MQDIDKEKDMLRILSCGSVDDGKSTLIGRILYDCGTLYEDQLELLEKERTSEGLPDFSRLLDGLLAEREQAITIDVAYRTFRTDKRRYLVADAPGHEQYTRNMVTGASRSDLALLLVDAVRAGTGLLPQTIRHTVICGIMGIPDIVVAVNKMDCLDYSREVFESIRNEYLNRVGKLPFRTVTCIPVSALRGDNVCRASVAMPWYEGPTLLDVLENAEPPQRQDRPFVMPVQWVALRPGFRGLAGTVVSGSARVGQPVALLPSGLTSTIRRIATLGGDTDTADMEEAVCIQLADDIDVGRGEVLTATDAKPETADQFAGRIVWLNDPPLVSGRTYVFRQGTAEARATVSELSSKTDLDTMNEAPAKELRPNDVGRIKLSLDRKLPFTSYAENRDLGGFLLVDRVSGNTLGAGMLEHKLHRSNSVTWHSFDLGKQAHASQKSQKPCIFWFMGLSGAGKSTLANLVAKMLHLNNRHVYILDGDNLRYGLNRDLGFTEHDRAENIRRASEVGHVLVDAGLVVLACFISPYNEDRAAVRERFEADEFFEIFVDTPMAVCAARDPKGLYAQAMHGELPNFTGISAPFEYPAKPDLRVQGDGDMEAVAAEVLKFIEERIAPKAQQGCQE